MSRPISGNPWVWAIVQGDPGNEQYVGQYDKKSGISFVPAFLTKKDAMSGQHAIHLEWGGKYEIQAVRYKELVKDATADGFVIFILDADGKLKEKIVP